MSEKKSFYGMSVEEVAEYMQPEDVLEADQCVLDLLEFNPVAADLDLQIGPAGKGQVSIFEGPNAVAGFQPGDAFTHGIDDTGHFVAYDHRRRWRVLIEALPSHDLGEVDARRSNADSDLALAGARVLVSSHFQDVRLAELRNPDRFHAALLTRAGTMSRPGRA